jgi:hypothetical protein
MPQDYGDIFQQFFKTMDDQYPQPPQPGSPWYSPLAEDTDAGWRELRQAAQNMPGVAVSNAPAPVRAAPPNEVMLPPIATASLPAAAPTPQQQAGQARYAAAEDDGVTFDPSSYDDLVDEMKMAISTAGLTRQAKPELEKFYQAKGGDLTLAKIDGLRQQLVANADDSPAAKVMLRSLDDQLSRLSTSDVQSSHPLVGHNHLRQAKQRWAHKARQEVVHSMVRKAQAHPKGLEHGLRKEYGKLLRSPSRRRHFNEHERHMIKRAAMGNL